MTAETQSASSPSCDARMRIVCAVTRAFLEGKSVRDVARQAVEDLARCVAQVRVNFYLRDGADTYRVVHSVSNTTFPSVEGFRVRTSAAWMPEFASTLVVGDSARDSRLGPIAEALAALGTRAFVYAPLLRDGKAYGALLLGAPTPREWTEDEIAVARDVAQVLALGMQKARAEEKRRVAEEELRAHRDQLQRLVEERNRHLVEAKEHAERADRAKSGFLSKVSHELRTPLHAILSFARLGRDKLRDGDADRTKLTHYFDRILSSGASLRALVDDLISLSRLDADGATLVTSMQDFDLLLDAAEWEVAESLRTKNQTVVRAYAAADLHVVCDRDRVVLALYHLLSNASKHSPSGSSIRVSVRETTLPARPAGDDGRTVAALEVSVIDQGPGVPVEQQESIFETFSPGSGVASGAGGRGLGLALCRQVARQHGADIRVSDDPAGGAVFTFLLAKEPWQATTPMDETRDELH